MHTDTLTCTYYTWSRRWLVLSPAIVHPHHPHNVCFKNTYDVRYYCYYYTYKYLFMCVFCPHDTCMNKHITHTHKQCVKIS